MIYSLSLIMHAAGDIPWNGYFRLLYLKCNAERIITQTKPFKIEINKASARLF